MSVDHQDALAVMAEGLLTILETEGVPEAIAAKGAGCGQVVIHGVTYRMTIEIIDRGVAA